MTIDEAASAAAWHRVGQERDALAVQLAHQWGWPDGESVLVRLRGDRTTALTTFCEDALLIYLGVKHDLALAAREEAVPLSPPVAEQDSL